MHTGSWGGWLTKIITFIAAIIGSSLPITGYWMFIRRIRKKHK
ncbi:PepSY domain-containing protein [Macellibacteroides fermentans]|nr:PepSY-associated TM helix domain-containing protein [Macellibacteroides fermentans]